MADCSSDVDEEIFYYPINTFFLKPRVAFILTFSLMYVMLLIQILKVQYMRTVYFKEALKMYLQIIVFSLSLLLTFLETVDSIGKTDFNNILKLVFAICCSSELLNIFYRIYRMVVDSWELFILLGVTLVLSAAFFRVLFYGIELD